MSDHEYKSFDELIERCRALPPLRTAVVYPCDKVSLSGVAKATVARIINPTLVGPEIQIRALAASLSIDLGGMDLFDAPETCKKVWPRVISGLAMDAMEEKGDSAVSADEVAAALESLQTEPWKPVAAAGAGEEQRSESPKWHGSVLTLNGTLVHGSLVAV